jgi:hypothetical protein
MTQHYIEIITWNKKMILKYGDKLTRTQKAIGLRSNGLHTEIRYSGRYGHVCFSCTRAGGVEGCRFMMHKLSHPYRQSRARIPVTAEQEARLFAKGCEMADVDPKETWFAAELSHEIDSGGDCFYGPNHIKYDKRGAMFAFLTKWNIIKMHEVRMICNEACAEVLLVEWPDLLVIDQEYHDAKADIGSIAPTIFIESYNNADPATLTPDIFEYMVRHYFYQEITDETTQEQETPA